MTTPRSDRVAATGVRHRWLIASWRNRTVYMDIRVPFTDRVLIFDIGRYPAFGWRYAR